MSSIQILFKAMVSVAFGDVFWFIRLKPRPQGREHSCLLLARLFVPQRLWLRFAPSPASSSNQLLGGGTQAGRRWEEARGCRLCGMWGD